MHYSTEQQYREYWRKVGNNLKEIFYRNCFRNSFLQFPLSSKLLQYFICTISFLMDKFGQLKKHSKYRMFQTILTQPGPLACISHSTKMSVWFSVCLTLCLFPLFSMLILLPILPTRLHTIYYRLNVAHYILHTDCYTQYATNCMLHNVCYFGLNYTLSKKPYNYILYNMRCILHTM